MDDTRLTCQIRGKVLMSVTMTAIMMASFQVSARRKKDKIYMVMNEGKSWWPIATRE